MFEENVIKGHYVIIFLSVLLVYTIRFIKTSVFCIKGQKLSVVNIFLKLIQYPTKTDKRKLYNYLIPVESELFTPSEPSANKTRGVLQQINIYKWHFRVWTHWANQVTLGDRTWYVVEPQSVCQDCCATGKNHKFFSACIYFETLFKSYLTCIECFAFHHLCSHRYLGSNGLKAWLDLVVWFSDRSLCNFCSSKFYRKFENNLVLTNFRK